MQPEGTGRSVLDYSRIELAPEQLGRLVVGAQ